ncbi:MAG: hypothetical protein A2W99_03630 [Bacteroidetes bacterium GWF2_33_16]|nr:MAG: hypothetical protein A2X00_11440 [Bacteroidetes bacterium GWE2_32_14]OFY08275.1 MAG: hypothetical protein A2W99_03630 [Bacteroidetes bacterium GWF2_33_16]
MKNLLKLRTFALLAMFMFLVFTVTSCMVVPIGKPGKGNKGNHKGWHKGKGNKHSQISTTPFETNKNSKV